MNYERMNNPKYHFFWGGPFSNWAESPFIVNGIKYSCGEQWMMHQKALLFRDYESADKIMNETNPGVQKALGRKVFGYTDEDWAPVRKEIVKIGLREKYLQNKSFLNYLLKYNNHIIVEASPYDRIWGIGYGVDDAMDNIDTWGMNLLGEILNEIGDELQTDRD